MAPPKLQNRSMSVADSVLAEIERTHTLHMENAIAAESRRGARGLSNDRINGFYWWKRYSIMLLHYFGLRRDRLRRLGNPLSRSNSNWTKLASRWTRREQELTNTVLLLDLINPMVSDGYHIKHRPDSWPRRLKLRCPICVAEVIQKKTSGRQERNKPTPYLQVWDAKPSQLFSLVNHVNSNHTDLGSGRICSVCRQICATEAACYAHQLLKHCSYDVPTAHNLGKVMFK